MNNLYDTHFHSKLYREEALQEARRRHFIEQARAGRKPRGFRQLELGLATVLTSLLRKAKPAA